MGRGPAPDGHPSADGQVWLGDGTIHLESECWRGCGTSNLEKGRSLSLALDRLILKPLDTLKKR